MMYRGIVTDRMGIIDDKKTKKYDNYMDAYLAAERMAKKYFTGYRANITIITISN